ncbi:hypothetical protein CDIK_1822 [Cucumispora dikerogammari]|nr:hypothetical protein CDIK_1822 [Cucumispora dikerogammari]
MSNIPKIKKPKKLKISDSARQALIGRVKERGHEIKHAAMLSDIPYEAAKKIYQKYVKSSIIIKSKLERASNKKVNSEVQQFIETNCQITLKALKVLIFRELNIEMSLSTIRNVIVDLKITLKKAVFTFVNINSPRTKELRQAYARDYLQNIRGGSIKCIFINESGLNLYLRRSFARSARVKDASVLVFSTKSTNQSLIFAISDFEVLFHKIISGPVNTNIFISFLESLISTCRSKNILDSAVFIMDNARIHHSHVLKDFIRTQNINVKYLSPYSYMLNPIEFSFSKIKMIVRRSLSERYEGNFHELISIAVNSITAEDIKGYFRHIERNCLDGLEMRDFV